MNLSEQGKEIVKRIQKAMEGFQKTFHKGFYNEEEMKIKNEWCAKIDEARKDWCQWLKKALQSN